MAGITYTYIGDPNLAISPNDPSFWTTTPPNGQGPSNGDSAIVNAGTVVLQDPALNANTIFLGGGTLQFYGDAATNRGFIVNTNTNNNNNGPSLDQSSIITTNVAAAEATPTSPQTATLDAFGNFINDGSIEANGVAGSTFTLAIAGTTIGGTYFPGYALNYGRIEVDAGNTMIISIAAGAELFNTGEIVVNGGSLLIDAAAGAIAGGFAPAVGAVEILNGGTLETNAAYAPTVTGALPIYAFVDATAGNTLKIDNIGSFGGRILGFGHNDTIDLGTSLSVGKVVYSSTSGILNLENAGGTILASLLLASGNFSSGTFAVAGGVAGSFTIATGTDGNTQITNSATNDIYSNASGTWQTGANWSNGQPGTLDTAFVGLGTKIPFTLTTGSTPVSVGALTMVSDRALLQITSNTTAGPYQITEFGGTLQVTAGNTLSAADLIMANGTLLVDPTAVFAIAGHVATGIASAGGTLAINNGNTLALINSGGTVSVNGGTIDAAPSISGGGGRIDIGIGGNGAPAMVTVRNSGTNAGKVIDTYTQLSSDPLSFGVLVLDGNVTWTDTIDPHDTVVTTGRIVVGTNNQAANSGTIIPGSFVNAATLLVENGATLTDQQNAIIAATIDSAGSATVQTGGIWNIGAGGLGIGSNGTGILSVQSAGSVTVGSGGINIGSTIASASGTLLVTDANSLFRTTGGINAGRFGQGLIQILNGGTLALTGTSGITAGLNAGSSGTISVGGTDANTGAAALLNFGTSAKGITVGSAGQGSLTVSSGGTIQMGGTGGILIGQSLGVTGVVTVSGSGALLNMGTTAGGITIGQAGTGTLQVLNAGTIQVNGAGGFNVGQFATGAGLLTVNGALINTGTAAGGISVGQAGTGTLQVLNGGMIALNGTGGLNAGVALNSAGLITVNGPGARITEGPLSNGNAIGQAGSGTLQVLNGASVAFNGTKGFTLGSSATGSGTVTVSGLGSAITTQGTAGNISIGAPGTGLLTIGNGGSVGASAGVFIATGGASASSGSVIVTSGTLTAGNGIGVGINGAGTLTIGSGGRVAQNGTAALLSIGSSTGSTGIVTVNTGGSLSVANGIDLGFLTGSSGTLLVNGGAVGNSGAIDLGRGGSGTVVVSNGGTLISSATSLSSGYIVAGAAGALFSIDSGGGANLSGGNVQIGGNNTSGTLSVGPSGRLIFNPGINGGFSIGATGSGTALASIGGGTVTANTSVNLGGNNGTLTIGNNGLLNAGTFGVQVNPNAGGSNTIAVGAGTLIAGGLFINNLATLANSANVSILAGGVVSVGQIVDSFGGTITVNGGSLSANNGVTIGQSGTGAVLNIGTGGVVTQTGANNFTIGGSFAGASGAVTIDGGTLYSTGGSFLLGGSNAAGTLLVTGGGTLITGGPAIPHFTGIDATGTGSAAATIDGGTWNAFDQIVVGDNGTGSLTVTNGGILNSGTNTISIGNQPGGNGTVTIGGTASRIDAGTLNIANNGTTASTLTVGTGGTVGVSNNLSIGGFGTLTMAGGILFAGGSAQNSGLIQGFGTLIASLANTGTIAAIGGRLVVTGGENGVGIDTIGNGATLEENAALGAGQSVSFVNGATGAALQLNVLTQQIQSFGLYNWQNGDRLYIANGVTVNSASFTNGTMLQVFTTGGEYDFTNVSVAPGASPIFTTGTNFVELICFCAGTLIGTPAGEVPVQSLKAGDIVVTAHNGPRKVTWLGKGKVLSTRGKRTAATPVIVRKSALADNVPAQDLHVTKAHSLYIDEVLIPVEFLVNHKSIIWDDRAQEVEIYHVEMESHDILIANGAPAESYRDDGNRWLFQNANSGWHLPPQEPYAPVLTGGPVVDTIWRRLLDRAGPRNLPPMTGDADVHLIVDGQRVDAMQTEGLVHVYHLSGRPASVRIASRDVVPAELGTARDPRPLGVALRRMAVRQGTKFEIVLAKDARLTDGFHAYEDAGSQRWTDGYASMPIDAFARFDGAMEVVLTLAGTAQYPLLGDAKQAAAA